MINTKGEALEEKKQAEIDKKKQYVDDGNRYIFPAGEAAPGANIAPVAGQPIDPSLVNTQAAEQVQAAAAMPMQETSFINPSQPQAQPLRTLAGATPTQTMATSGVPGVSNQSGQIDKAFSDFNQQTNDFNSQLDAVAQQKMAAIQQRIDESDKNIDKVEPKGFFEGKSTWQKLLGGVGLFLSSFTPEGARNVANIIDREIERDIDAQKTNIKLKREKADNNFKLMLEKYGTQEAALLAKKRDAFGLLDAHLKKLEMNARNEETRARIAMGREELALKRQSLTNELIQASLKQTQEAAKGSIPGYQGSNQNPSIVEDLTDRVAAKNSAMASITRLESLLKEGALVGKNAALAEQIREDLAAALAKAKFGRSSDSELEVTRGMIPDITSIMQRGSTDKEMFKSLRTQIAKDVDAAATAAGYTPATPSGARKM